MSNRKKKAHIQGQQGIILIFALVFVPVLLAFLALAIDLGKSQAAMEKIRALTRLLALSATKQYNDDEAAKAMNIAPPGVITLEKRLKAVHDRINQIAERHYFAAHPGQGRTFKPLGYPWDYNWASGNASREGGLILPGIYYASDPYPASVDSHVTCPTTGYPKFCTLKAGSGGTPDEDSSINAFKITADYASELDTSFAKVAMGIRLVNLRPVSAVASVLPRHIVFLVDKSNSSVATTHPLLSTALQKGTPANAPASRGIYAYGINNTEDPKINSSHAVEKNGVTITSVTTPNFSTVCNSSTDSGLDFTDACQWNLLKNYNVLTNAYDGLGQSRGASGLTDPDWGGVTQHYHDDYEEIDTWRFHTDYGSLGAVQNPSMYHVPDETVMPAYKADGGSYLVDRENAAGGAPRYPEPLKSIFDGLHQGITQFEARHNSGDKAAFVFFDSSLSWTGVTKLTAEWDYLKELSDFANNVDKIKLLQLFPGRRKNTNITLALAEATETLLADEIRVGGAPSSDSVIYIGDFLPNCKSAGPWSCASSNCNAICREGQTNPPNTICANPTGTLNFSCSNEYGYFKEAVSQLHGYAIAKLIPNQISFSAIIMGDHVGPHVLDVTSGASSACLTDGEARSSTPPKNYVLGGDEDGNSYLDFPPGSNYNVGYWSTDLMDWSMAYRIMDADHPFYEATAQAYYLTRATGGIFLPILDKPSGCVPDPTGCNAGKRRKVDRQCRTQQAQIVDAINQIIKSDTPYRIVDAE